MITRHLLFPDQIGSYYLFSPLIAGIYIDNHSVRAIIMRASGLSRIVEQCFEELVSQDTAIPLFDRITQALRHILERIPQKCMVTTILPSTVVVYKTITTPLISLSKIKQLIPFEIESSLPFSLADAYIDSIVVGKNEDQKTAEVLVAATRRDSLNEHISFFKAINKMPDRVTTDVVGLCGLINELQRSLQKPYPFIVINIEYQTTTIILFEKSRITHIRTLQHGSLHFNEKSPSDAPLTTSLIATLTSLADTTTQEIMICGPGINHESLCSELQQTLNISCTPLSIKRIINTHVITSQLTIDNQFLLPLASALPSKVNSDFDINVEATHKADVTLITHQIILALTLITLTLIALVSVRMITISQLRSEIQSAEQETIKLLTTELKLKLNPGAAKSLDLVMNAARTAVVSQEKIWFSLSQHRRALALKALEELSRILNRQELKLQLQKLSITENDSEMLMTLTGSVAEFKALDILQESFKKSSLLTLKEKIPNTSFVTQIIISTEEL